MDKTDNQSCFSEENISEARREMCTTPHMQLTDDFSELEIQSRIDELNEKYETDSRYDDEVGAINVDEFFIMNYKKNRGEKSTSDVDGRISENNEVETSVHFSERSSKTVDDVNKNGQNQSSTSISNLTTNLTVKGNNKLSEFEVINQDSYLKPHEKKIRQRVELFRSKLREIEKNEGSLLEFTESYKQMGLNVTEEGITYKEYAPGARSLTIFGDFNNWNRDEYHCRRDEFGFWTLTIPPEYNGELVIKHNSKVKVNLTLPNGKREDRNPVWSRYLIQNKDSLLYDTVFWHPEAKYQWKNEGFHKRPTNLRIYEAHVGMSSIEPRVTTYREFADLILPRVKEAGYTAIQLMAIMEHAYYGSFGYHVTNYFAVASRSGTPDDLKYMMDTAHGMGLYVIMDIIHSHASSNVLDGINHFDGTDYLYFHGGPRGFHKLWDSRVFNYSNWETLRLLLSNCAWYMDEYHFDGFRFDGVTSMLYAHHGINYAFSGGLSEYYNDGIDMDGQVYLMLANYLIHTKNPEAISIAEDVSGMPTLCRPIEEGGFGFDYRLNMSVPDKWIQLLKEHTDESWNIGNICFTLTNRRYNEKHVGYSESHDQAIVGDKTISMWLFDQEIYHNMGLNKHPTIVVDRGMALHKMIRLITFTLSGEAYMNFMGNEFGHPEWIDFPRVGNNFSYHFCRRQWDLCDDKSLRYTFLFNFDKAMNRLDDIFHVLNAKSQFITLMHEKDKLIIFERGDLLFVFNFHPSQSFEHYRVGTRWGSEHFIILDSDESRFGGKNRLSYGHNNKFPVKNEKWNHRNNYFQMYIPSRTVIVLIAEENVDKYDLTKLQL